MQIFDTILPGEKNVLTFDMADGLVAGNLLAGTPSVTVTTYEGTDPNPSAIVNGTPVLDSTSTKILVAVIPTVDYTQYLFVVSSATAQTSVMLKLQAVLPVSSANCCN